MSAPVRVRATAPGHSPGPGSGKRQRRACPRCGVRRQTNPKSGQLCRDCQYVLPPDERATWTGEDA